MDSAGGRTTTTMVTGDFLLLGHGVVRSEPCLTAIRSLTGSTGSAQLVQGSVGLDYSTITPAASGSKHSDQIVSSSALVPLRTAPERSAPVRSVPFRFAMITPERPSLPHRLLKWGLKSQGLIAT